MIKLAMKAFFFSLLFESQVKQNKKKERKREGENKKVMNSLFFLFDFLLESILRKCIIVRKLFFNLRIIL